MRRTILTGDRPTGALHPGHYVGSLRNRVAVPVHTILREGTARTAGTLTIAGRTFTVNQAGCTYSLGGTGRSVPASGVQSASLGVGAPAGCAWTMTSHDSWIIITSGPRGLRRPGTRCTTPPSAVRSSLSAVAMASAPVGRSR